MPFGLSTRMGPRKDLLHGGAYWQNLANTIELSVCGADAAFLSNYFDHLYLLIRYYKRMAPNPENCLIYYPDRGIRLALQ